MRSRKGNIHGHPILREKEGLFAANGRYPAECVLQNHANYGWRNIFRSMESHCILPKVSR
jgi:hypothetical protein